MAESSRTPGFTAEAAVGRASRAYPSPRARTGGAVGEINPQAVLGGQPDGCIPGCICITEEGCPCCSSVLPNTKPAVKRIVR